MCKKIVSVFIAVLMVASMATVAITSVSAASPSFSGGTIYWECPWDVAKQAYCHVYGSDGTALYDWQTKDEKMTLVEGNTWSYEVPAGAYDEVIFSIDTGAQTYDLVMTDDNIGDTAVTEKDNKIENPMDSNKSASRTTWKSGKNGPHLAITSIGNIVGDVLAPTESAADFVATFIKNYYPTQPEYVTAEVLKSAMDKAGATAEDVYATCESYGDALTADQLSEIKGLLGVSDTSSTSDTNSSGDTTNSGSDSGSGTTSTSSSGSTSTASTSSRSSSSTTSTTSSGTTTTGDSTPYVVLGIVLVAALGVAVIAAKKKTAE